MSKIVSMSRNQGEFLTRFDSKFGMTGEKTPQFATIIVPDARGEFYKRIGSKYIVEENSIPTDVFRSFDLSVLSQMNVPGGDINHDNIVANQTEASCEEIATGVYRLFASGADLKSFEIANKEEGEHKWIALEILTDEDTSLGIEVNGYVVEEADVSEAEAFGCPNGALLCWIPFERGTQTIVLRFGNKATAITIIAVDTSAV